MLGRLVVVHPPRRCRDWCGAVRPEDTGTREAKCFSWRPGAGATAYNESVSGSGVAWRRPYAENRRRDGCSIPRGSSPLRVSAHRDFFSEPTEFDGGFTAEALIRPGWEYEDFANIWLPTLPNTLRKIRNCLVHARERRMVSTIVASKANQKRLQPWQMVIEIIAGQVIGLTRM